MSNQNVGIKLDADPSGLIAGINKTDAALKKHQKVVANTQKHYKGLQKAHDSNRNANRQGRAQLAQFGHQFQDFAVQIQGGQSALLAFTQQGSQLVSAFGAKGAIAGMFIAIGGAVAGALVPSLMKGKDATKEMEEAVSDLRDMITNDDFGVSHLSDELLGLGKISEQVFINTIEAGVIKARNATKTSVDEMGNKFRELDVSYGFYDLADAANAFTSKIGEAAIYNKGFAEVVTEVGESFGLTGDDAYRAGKQIAKMMSDIKKAPTSDKFDQLQTVLNKLAQNTGASDEVKLFVSSLGELFAQGKLTASQLEYLQQKLNGLGDASSYSDSALRQTNSQINNLAQQITGAQIKLTSGTQAFDAYNFALGQGYTSFSAMPDVVKEFYTELQRLNAETEDQKANEDFIANLDKIRNKQVLSEAQMLALQASNYNLNEEQQKTLNLIIAELNARDALTKKQKEEAAAKKAKAEADKAERERQAKMKPEADRIRNVVSDFFALEESMLTEEGIIKKSHANRLKQLDDYYDIVGEKDQKYNDMKAKIDQDRDNALAKAEQDKAMTVAGSMNTQLQQLASFFDESTALGKAAYVANQGMAIANAIISAEEASAKALALYPGMPAYAGMIKAMGYASAGAIAGQTLASFEGGGITFSGARSGGLDGKGGKMAVVHPNEKITDLEKGGSTGQPVQVSFSINAVDTQGIDKLLYERRGMITSMVQKAVNNRGKRIM
jgi:hypothetical protein